MNVESASYLGLVGSGLSIAAFFGLTAMGILFVRLLDGIKGYCRHVEIRWKKTKALVSGLESAGAGGTKFIVRRATAIGELPA
jgi:hypothetical protein